MSLGLVSVVMAVRDGGAALAATLESVLAQRDIELELIVVDDGSRDGSSGVVRSLAASDSRVRLLEREPRGLTEALIAGCESARGDWIARQDCGDRSFPNRLSRLRSDLERDPAIVLTSGGTRFLAPRGELLYEIVQRPEEADAGLRAGSPERLRGPSIHGCVAFRRDAYLRAGGYRAEFRVAQDLDLWLRLAELGTVSAVPEVLYEATFGLGSISALQREVQVRMAALAFETAVCRRRGESEAEALRQARVVATSRLPARASARARAAYFVGSCLSSRDRPAARYYFGRALAANPLHVKALIRWLLPLP